MVGGRVRYGYDTAAAVIANKRACFEPSPAAAAIPEVYYNYNSKYTSLLLYGLGSSFVCVCVCV